MNGKTAESCPPPAPWSPPPLRCCLAPSPLVVHHHRLGDLRHHLGGLKHQLVCLGDLSSLKHQLVCLGLGYLDPPPLDHNGGHWGTTGNPPFHLPGKPLNYSFPQVLGQVVSQLACLWRQCPPPLDKLLPWHPLPSAA